MFSNILQSFESMEDINMTNVSSSDDVLKLNPEFEEEAFKTLDFHSILSIIEPFERGVPRPNANQPEVPTTWSSLNFFPPRELFPFVPTFNHTKGRGDEEEPDLRLEFENLFLKNILTYDEATFQDDYDDIENDKNLSFEERKKAHINNLNQYLCEATNLKSGEFGYLLMQSLITFEDETCLRWPNAEEVDFFHSNEEFFRTPPAMYTATEKKERDLRGMLHKYRIKAPRNPEREQSETTEQSRTDNRQRIFEKWRESPIHRVVKQIIFDPSRPPAFTEAPKQPKRVTLSFNKVQPYVFSHYNEWMGLPFLCWPFADLTASVKLFGDQEVYRTVDLFLWHWLNVICSGIRSEFEYQFKYITYKFSHPHTNPEVALVTFGDKGLGKTMFWQFIASLFGSAALYLQKPRQLTESNFGMGALSENKVFMVVDELKIEADSKFEEEFKTLITAKERNIERKRKDPRQVPHMLAIVTTTNSPNAFSSNIIERRMMVTHASRIVADAPKEIREKYFTIWAKHFSKGSTKMIISALFYHFAFSDQMENWNSRSFLKTEAQMEMEMNSFTLIEQWYYEELHRIDKAKEPEPTPAQRENPVMFNQFKEVHLVWSKNRDGYELNMDHYFLSFVRWINEKGLNCKPKEATNSKIFWDMITRFTGVEHELFKSNLPRKKRPRTNTSSSSSSSSFENIFHMPSIGIRKKAWARYKGWDNFY